MATYNSLDECNRAIAALEALGLPVPQEILDQQAKFETEQEIIEDAIAEDIIGTSVEETEETINMKDEKSDENSSKKNSGSTKSKTKSIWRKILHFIILTIIFALIIVGAIWTYGAYIKIKERQETQELTETIFNNLYNSSPELAYNTALTLLSEEVLESNNIKLSTEQYKESALDKIKKLAEDGYDRAQYSLGMYYAGYRFEEKRYSHYSKDITSDSIEYDKAAYWWLQSANQGNPKAMSNIASSYLIGQGVAENPEKALYWYRKSIEKGGDAAALYLGDCFRDGLKVKIQKKVKDYWGYKWVDDYKVILEANIDSAIYYWNLADERGHPKAKDRLQKIYE